MPSPAAVEAFVAQVLRGDHVGAIRDWYAADASMQENQAPPRRGRETLMAQEAAVLDAAEQVRTELVEPPLIEANRVAIRWRFTFRMKSGQSFQMEEIAWQTWREDKVVEEVFFYDPGQRLRALDA